MSSLEMVEFDTYAPVDDEVSLEQVLGDAKSLASSLHHEIKLSFHGRTIKVCEDSDLGLLARDYQRCRWGFIEEVGPHPQEISEERLADEKKALGRPWEVESLKAS